MTAIAREYCTLKRQLEFQVCLSSSSLLQNDGCILCLCLVLELKRHARRTHIVLFDVEIFLLLVGKIVLSS